MVSIPPHRGVPAEGTASDFAQARVDFEIALRPNNSNHHLDGIDIDCTHRRFAHIVRPAVTDCRATRSEAAEIDASPHTPAPQ
jgi:hypothetical protein